MKTVPVWRINILNELSHNYQGFMLIACELPSKALAMYGYYLCKDICSINEIPSTSKHIMSLDIFYCTKTNFNTKINEWDSFKVISDCVNDLI